MGVIVLILLPFCFSVKIRKAAAFAFGECWASPVVYINMFNVLFQPAKKLDQTPKEKETKSGENQVQFKIIL